MGLWELVDHRHYVGNGSQRSGFMTEYRDLPRLRSAYGNGVRRVVELAQLCARNADAATSDDVIQALWRMAKEYRAQAALLGAEPNIGEPPSRMGRQPERLRRSGGAGQTR